MYYNVNLLLSWDTHQRILFADFKKRIIYLKINALSLDVYKILHYERYKG